MDFTLNSEQAMLRDSARRCLSDASRSDADRWCDCSELGWLAMAVAESDGGLGAAPEDLAILCEEFGRALSGASFVGGALLPARVIARAADAGQRQQYLPDLIAGERRYALAIYEPGRRYALQPGTTAQYDDDGTWRLRGHKIGIAGGAQADLLIVSAGTGAPDEVGLFLVNATAAGVQRRSYENHDGVRVADVVLTDTVAVSRLSGGECDAQRALDESLDDAVTAQCAELIGVIDRALEMTVEHLKTRRQFGRALADFQALQHAVAELFVEADSARSILYRAVANAGAPSAERIRAVSGARLKIVDAARRVTGMAVHLHGGIGVSAEYPVGHFLRRVTVAERTWGDREHHLERYLAAG